MEGVSGEACADDCDIDLDVAHLQCAGRRRLGRSEPRADACDELLGVERLDDIVVRSALEAAHDVGGVGLRGEHDHRHAGLGTDLRAHLDAVLAGQHEVEEHEVGFGCREDGEGLGAVSAEDRLEPLGSQYDADHFGEGGIVVNHQDARSHRHRLRIRHAQFADAC